MSWKVLITARTLDIAGADALKILRDAGCQIITPPKYGPLTEAELLPQLEGINAVLASTSFHSATGETNTPAFKSVSTKARAAVT